MVFQVCHSISMQCLSIWRTKISDRHSWLISMRLTVVVEKILVMRNIRLPNFSNLKGSYKRNQFWRMIKSRKNLTSKLRVKKNMQKLYNLSNKVLLAMHLIKSCLEAIKYYNHHFQHPVPLLGQLLNVWLGMKMLHCVMTSIKWFLEPQLPVKREHAPKLLKMVYLSLNLVITQRRAKKRVNLIIIYVMKWETEQCNQHDLL